MTGRQLKFAIIVQLRVYHHKQSAELPEKPWKLITKDLMPAEAYINKLEKYLDLILAIQSKK